MDFDPIPFYISGFLFMFIVFLGLLSEGNAEIIIGAFAAGIALIWWGTSIGDKNKADRAAYKREMRTYDRWLILARVLKNMEKKLDNINQSLGDLDKKIEELKPKKKKS